jgi:Protein of unknown function (DUF1761)
MSISDVNAWAVIVAAAVSFLFGGVWYGTLSKAWMKAAGLKLEDIKPADGLTAFTPYAVAFFSQLVMAAILASVIGPLWQGQITVRSGVLSGLEMWLGFVVTTIAVNHSFQMQPRALTIIDSGHWLGVLLIQGALLGWFGPANG